MFRPHLLALFAVAFNSDRIKQFSVGTTSSNAIRCLELLVYDSKWFVEQQHINRQKKTNKRQFNSMKLSIVSGEIKWHMQLPYTTNEQNETKWAFGYVKCDTEQCTRRHSEPHISSTIPVNMNRVRKIMCSVLVLVYCVKSMWVTKNELLNI